MRRAALAIAAATALLAFAGCGDDDSSTDTETTEPAPAATVPTETATTETGSTTDASKSIRISGVGKDLDKKPKIPEQSGTPPSELVVKDIVEGTGKEAKAGDEVEVKYVGVLYDSGEEFDSSWKRNEPFAFSLGTGSVIPGWDQGVAGMREGGRRMLVIPPDLAYGDQGSGPIGPNATLVFVVDLVDVK